MVYEPGLRDRTRGAPPPRTLAALASVQAWRLRAKGGLSGLNLLIDQVSASNVALLMSLAGVLRDSVAVEAQLL